MLVNEPWAFQIPLVLRLTSRKEGVQIRPGNSWIVAMCQSWTSWLFESALLSERWESAPVRELFYLFFCKLLQGRMIEWSSLCHGHSMHWLWLNTVLMTYVLGKITRFSLITLNNFSDFCASIPKVKTVLNLAELCGGKMKSRLGAERAGSCLWAEPNGPAH